MTGDQDTYRVTVIAGPTASGKSAEALKRAQEKDGVIVNADSMQIYAALPVLTAQPSGEDLRAAPHCLYGVLPPSERCSAARWRDMALAAIEAARASGKRTIICGGTGFYLLSLIEGLSPMPDIAPDLRETVQQTRDRLGAEAFFDELARRDPIMAERLHPNDTQRVVRAYEVFEATGKSLSYWQALPKEPPPEHLSFDIVRVMPKKSVLHARIERRFDRMVVEGALDEVEGLMQAIARGGVPRDAPITHALGYQQLAAFVRGEISLDEAVALAKTVTRQYAKRQMTFLRTQLP